MVNKDNKVRKELGKKLKRLIDDYTEADFVGQLDLIAGLAGFDNIKDMREGDLLSALDNYFDQEEINDLFIETNIYGTEEDE